MAASDAELLALGRAVHAFLIAPGQHPRTLLFEIFDHKRVVAITPVASFKEDDAILELIKQVKVKFPDRVF